MVEVEGHPLKATVAIAPARSKVTVEIGTRHSVKKAMSA